MSLDLWLTFVAASAALLLIPGPTVLLVLSYALSKGRSVALACAAGVALGDLIAMTASLAGLGALVLASATLFGILKWFGAAYLVYLGVRLLRSAPSERLGKVATGRDVTARGRIGFVPAAPELPGFLTVDEAWRMMADLRRRLEDQRAREQRQRREVVQQHAVGQRDRLDAARRDARHQLRHPIERNPAHRRTVSQRGSRS